LNTVDICPWSVLQQFTQALVLSCLWFTLFSLYSEITWIVKLPVCNTITNSGGFRGVSRNHSGFPSTMGAPLFSYKVSRGIHSGLNSGVTGFCFNSKLRKCSENLFFFWSPRRKIEDLRKKFVSECSVTGNFARRSHRTHTVKVRHKQAIWKVLSKISRTAPAHSALQSVNLRMR